MDVVQILDVMEANGLIRLHKVVGDYYQVYCPIHNDGNERKPSCGVLLHEQYKNGQRYPQGWTHCFSCGYVNTLPELISDILKSKHISQSGLDWLLKNVPGFEADNQNDFELLIPEDMMKSLNDKYALSYIKSQLEEAPQYVSEEELSKYRFTVPYMYERKLTDEVIEKYDVGVDMNWIAPGRKKPTPCITFPVRDGAGNTLFFCRRSIGGKLFNYPTGVNKPVYGLFELPKDAKSIIICESCFNALTAVVWGYNAVALLGTGNALQIQQLKELGVQEFVLCMDGDEAGKKATNKLKRALWSTAITWTIDMPPGKDINSCTKEEFIELYAKRY